MENITPKESPDIKTKIVALIAVAKEPVTRNFILDIIPEWGVDRNDPTLDAQLDEVLQGNEIQTTENAGEKLYSIAPEKSGDVAARIESIRLNAINAICDAGMRHFGIE